MRIYGLANENRYRHLKLRANHYKNKKSIGISPVCLTQDIYKNSKFKLTGILGKFNQIAEMIRREMAYQKSWSLYAWSGGLGSGPLGGLDTGRLDFGCHECLDSGRLVSWTLDVSTLELLMPGSLDSRCLDVWTLDAQALDAWTQDALTLGFWTLGLWTVRCLESAQVFSK